MKFADRIRALAAEKRLFCSSCTGADAEFLRALSREFPHCPTCGRSLEDEIKSRESGGDTERDQDTRTHRSEQTYAQTSVMIPVDRRTITVDAHELLEYAAVLAALSQRVEAELAASSETAVVGFMAGSYGILFLTKLRRGKDDRIYWADGLRHPTLTEAEPRFHSILGRIGSTGVSRIVIVDEMVRGTQLRTALYSIGRWQRATGRNVSVHVIAAFEGRSEATGKQLMRTLQPPRSKTKAFPTQLSGDVVAANRLFAKDRNGNIWRGLTWDAHEAKYRAVRENPGPIYIACPNMLLGGATGAVASVGSHDQTFASMIRRIVGDLPDFNGVWPATIQSHDCKECKRLLRLARADCGRGQRDQLA